MIKYISSKKNIQNDILAGITTSLAMIPEVVAFAFVAQIDPIIALTGAFIIGLIAAFFGGRPALISGAAGAVAVIFVEMIQIGHQKGIFFENPVENMGYYYLFATVLLMGLIQIFAGLFKLGKFVKLIPYPVMLGFVNGLAMVIFWSQVKMFTHKSILLGVNGEKIIHQYFMSGQEFYIMLGLVIFTMILIYLIPKISKKIPASLTAILITTIITVLFKINVTTVGSYIIEGGGNGLKASFPTLNTTLWKVLPLNLDTLYFILPYAFLAAAVGLIETLMTMNLVDEITETRGDGNKECVAQGIGNVFCGLFGGTGGCGMIGQTMINLKSNGRGRLSGMTMAITLLFFILFAATYIEQVPLAALVGVMFVMVIDTFAWSSIRIISKIPKSDAFVLATVSVVTVVFDLAIAVLVGVVIAALVFAWQNAVRIRARRKVNENGVVYEIWGPLFFGSTATFNQKFQIDNDPNYIEIDFIDSRVSDYSGLEAIRIIVAKYQKVGKTVKLIHLSKECKDLLTNVDKKFAEIIIEDVNDPSYYMVADSDELSNIQTNGL